MAYPSCVDIVYEVRSQNSLLDHIMIRIRVLILWRSRFLLVVLSVYKQIRAEPFDVLSDVTEENFDKAFDFIRPGALWIPCLHLFVPLFRPFNNLFFVSVVIQGNADLGPRLSESEVQSALGEPIFASDPTMSPPSSSCRATHN